MSSQAATKAIVIATAAVFGLTYGLSAPLISLELSDAGYSKTAIGANSAMYAIGVLMVAPFLPHLSWRFGLEKVAKGALIVAAALFAAFPAAPFFALWFALRAALGAASESLFVISETWLNQVTKENRRAQTMAIYTATLSGGIALGPIILVLVGRHTSVAFLIGAGLALIACLVIVFSQVQADASERPVEGNLLRYLHLAPIAVAASALNAALETAGLGLLPLYAIGLGWTEQSATILLTVLLIGSILLQLPIGWLGDRIDRRRLVTVLAGVSTLGALAWPVAFKHDWLAYPLLFLWGGAFVGIYTTMLAFVGNRFKDGDLVGIYAVLSVAWGIGALLGPLLGGAAMEITPHGLPWFAAASCFVFAAFSLTARPAKADAVQS